MTQYRFEVKLTLIGPVVSQGLATRGPALDLVALRDAENRLALPGTLVRGRLREAWLGLRELAPGQWSCADRIESWLGPEPGETEGPRLMPDDAGALPPSLLRFDEYWLADMAVPEPGADLRHRIRMDDDLGAVQSGQLLVMETNASGAEIVFAGGIRAELDDVAAAEALRHCLENGLGFVPAFGAMHSVGHGRLKRVDVTCQTVQASGVEHINQETASGIRIGLRLTPREAFCFPLPMPRSNRFVSSDHIPGAAIKAVLAARLLKEGKPDWFDGLRVTHALPVKKGRAQRPVAVPLSLAWARNEETGKQRWCDLARFGEPGLVFERAPSFASDWKPGEREKCQKACGHESPPGRRLIVRNRIDPETGTVKEGANGGGMLFSVEVVEPGDCQWLANLTVPDISGAERDAALERLAKALAMDLEPMGKTHVAMRCETSDAPFSAFDGHRALIGDDGTVIVTLQSQALLLPPDVVLRGTNGGFGPKRGWDWLGRVWRWLSGGDRQARLHDHYAAAWAELSGQTLNLRHSFASQSLAGGAYWWKRFRRSQEPYRPVVLTNPGSVFVLHCRNENRARAELVLKEWRNIGLPQLATAPGGTDFTQNPWLRENGYGEVLINASMHWNKAPSADEWQEVGHG